MYFLDGRLVAIVESPWADQYGRLFGEHRLLVLEKESNLEKLALQANSFGGGE
ncbi:hypothetical protein [Thermodesulfatator autotrophicus]|uniref:hypothetical protein n=1 Tax=Thermodesulfatator autotrophicus TaxID=1795632 RepID=UPI0012FC1F8F|nr:hypothetical protein [Thermodesulfatator autotrophicus]